MLVTVHQLRYLPWLRYFEKIARSDLFIVLDDDPYRQGGWQNRNLIKLPTGPAMLTVPVHAHFGARLNEVEIVGADWAGRHWKTLAAAYGRAPYFKRYAPVLEAAYRRQWRSLGDLNLWMLMRMLEMLGINTPVRTSSSLGVAGHSTERMARICRAVGADSFLTGSLGLRAYLDLAVMEARGIRVQVEGWRCPEYAQRFAQAGFIPDLSAVDLLFNVGRESLPVLLAGGAAQSAGRMVISVR